ncbi:hypothetical protein D1B31_15945 [Neobacillus notoginsengisoli]|uniref:WD40 repeat domain-containing protein n=1 Tax=Neobacillus notoginsengisoli TaxID=1578198 RepID=A0A417YRD0_9BACI|nr:hypothetical protein [Neobacillus notoginsengisoli]RHW37259.1 hypothetical protein D1B31_15945 [Neobacillus notoginsengisoli]
MKKILSFFVTIAIIVSSLYVPLTSSASDPCAGIKPGQKIYWNGSELKAGQIGRLQILKDTPLFKLLPDGSLKQEKMLKKGTFYRIYNFKGDLLGVGGGYFVNRDTNVSYTTPSKAKLQAVTCANKPASQTPAPAPQAPATPVPVPQDNVCAGITPGQKVYWNGSELKPGQIGRLQILKDTPLFKLLPDGSLKHEKVLKKGTFYRIYNFKSDLLGVGGGYFVKRDTNVSYTTPSKTKLQAVACANKPASETPAPAPQAPVTPAPAPQDNVCTGITPGQKIYWDGGELKPGQIGRVTVISDTTLYKMIGSSLTPEKTLPKGGVYRIYSFKGDLLGVGGGYYVKRDSRITYNTPSKAKLQAVQCANGITPPAVPLHGKKPVNLGPMVFNQSTIAAKSGMDSNGNAYMYVILHGTPSALAVVDLNTNKVIGVYNLTDSTSAWGLDVDSAGIAWIAGTNRGTLYSYNPISRKLSSHGHVVSGTNDTSIQDIFVNDQYVFGVTAYGANVFKYNKLTSKREFILPTQKGKQYAKAVVADNDNKYLYVSSGATAELVRWDLSNNAKVSILPEQYKKETYAEKLKLIDNRFLFAKLYPSKKAAVYDIAAQRFISEFPSASRGFSEKNPTTNEVYYSNDAVLYGYNMSTGVTRNTGAKLLENTEALSLDFVNLKTNPENSVLVGLIDNKGSYYVFDPVSNEISIRSFAVPAQPVNLHLLFTSPDKRYIYVNGYMSGGLTQYNPVTKETSQLNGISQLESAVHVNGKMYVGAYPNARLTEIVDSSIPWDQRTPNVLARIKDYGQERIAALTSVNNHLFAGTYPQYTSKGGLIMDYDLKTNTHRVYENYINNQSIISLHPFGGYIYGGTSIHANYQKDPNGAKLFRFNPANPGQKQIITLPLKASMVMSLFTGPDNQLWGAADGTIFAYNPANNTFRSVKMFNAISGRYGNARMLTGKDGYIYGTLEGSFFKMDPKTMKYSFILTSGAKDLVDDSAGNLYFRHLENLYMYPLK